MDPGLLVAAASSAGLAWSGAAVALRPRDPVRGHRILSGALGLFALLALVIPAAPGMGVAIAVAVAAGAVAGARSSPWARRGTAALLMGALTAAGFSWGSFAELAPPAMALGGFGALHAARPGVVFPAAARALAAGALATTASWAAARAGLGSGFVAAIAIGAGFGAVVAVEAGLPRLRDWPRPGPWPVPPVVGDVVLDRYRVRRHLGGGANGETFEAEDEVLGGRVAVKWLRRAAAGDAGLAREARALAAVDHPNVVRLLSVGTDRHHGTLLVLEYVEGGSLADRLRAGALPRREFERVASSFLDALAAVHARGLVHQDVKPSNVLLAGDGIARLADFGVARLPGIEATAGGDAIERPVGTLRFMPPEQARGRRATPASDVFAAGATLYEALTGRPYTALEGVATMEDAVERLTARGPFDHELPDARLRPFFERALAPGAPDRFQDGAAMREAFSKAIAADPTPV